MENSTNRNFSEIVSEDEDRVTQLLDEFVQQLVSGENSKGNSRNPNINGISGEDKDYGPFGSCEDLPYSSGQFPRVAETNSDSRRNIPESIETERVLKIRSRKREIDKEYRTRKKGTMLSLTDENKQLKMENQILKQEIDLLKQKTEIQSRELDWLRKMRNDLEKKNIEEVERNHQLVSDLKTREAKIESLKDELLELLKQRIVKPTFETRSNNMD